MPLLKVCYKASDNEARVLLNSTANPSGFTKLDEFEHPDGADTHVIFHHVRDILYKTSRADLSAGFFPDNITDMQRVKIIMVYKAVQAIYARPARVLALEVGDTQATVVTYMPADATTKTATYVSSDTDVATVNASGEITGVAEGECEITVKATDNPKAVDTIKVKVVAAEE